MELDLFREYGPALLRGLGVTIFCWIVGTACAMALGFLLALVQRGVSARPVQWILRAYVEFSLLDDLDPSDLALLADARLRDKLSDQWMRRLDPWFGSGLDDPRVRSVRLLADGAWFDRPLGIVELSRAQRESMLSVALGLISEGVQK